MIFGENTQKVAGKTQKINAEMRIFLIFMQKIAERRTQNGIFAERRTTKIGILDFNVVKRMWFNRYAYYRAKVYVR